MQQSKNTELSQSRNIELHRELPIFSLRSRCSKCGCTDIKVQWRAERMAAWEDRLLDDEYMLRTCTMCGYRWAELPLDKAPDLVQLAGPDPQWKKD